MNMDDRELLRDYTQHRSDRAFAELVRRHIDLVYSTALRMVREATLAEDVAQAVFVQLARKAPSIQSGNALPGWLYRVTHCQAANALRAERTRRQYETEAMNMTQAHEEPAAAWESIAPQLEEAMSALDEEDQNAVVQRYFQGRSWREVGAALALSEDAAQKRVSRAVEKMRSHFARRGIVASAAVIASAIAANAAQTAPAGLAASVTTASLAGVTGTGASTFATALKALLVKKATIGILAVVAVTAAVTVPLAVSQRNNARSNAPVTEKSLAQGLVLHMTFDKDETGIGKVTDASGKENHGRPSGVQWTPDGKKGGAYEFTADGNEIVIANNASLNPKQLTLAAWIKTTTKDAIWRRIFDKSYSQGFALSIAGDWQQTKWRGLVSLEIGPGTYLGLTKSTVADGQWHHVVATFDGSDELLYVDGQPQSKLRWNNPGQVGTTGFNLVIGCNRSSLGDYDIGMSFRGLIDEPMMWNRALSAEEVAFLFESQN
jgi:RNA polymerase sigma factor (sigma-70 family)